MQAAGGRTVKVILENAYLDDDHKVTACRLAEAAGAQFVKTSTGFAPSGAMLADVALMRSAVGGRLGIKAAGGVRTMLDALSCSSVTPASTALRRHGHGRDPRRAHRSPPLTLRSRHRAPG